MGAMTIRGISDETRANLRRIAAEKGVSVEALARDKLTELAGSGGARVAPYEQSAPLVNGFREGVLGWNMGQQSKTPSFETLSGALSGLVHLTEGTDLTAPTGELWDAEAGLL